MSRLGRRRPSSKKKKETADWQSSPADKQLKEVAEAIRAEFIRRRRFLVEGAALFVGPKTDIHFLKAAELSLVYQESPAVFVQRTFDYLIKHGALLYPEAMGSARVALDARSNKVDRDALAIAKYRAQLEKWDRYSKFGSAANTLRSHRAEFAPLLCYLMATKLNEPEIAQECRDAAKAELLANPVGFEVFSGLVEGLL